MINVSEVLKDIPHFDTFCSVEKLHQCVESLRGDTRFSVEVVGTSASGAPIHHVRFGTGSVKAMFVAFPHCMEPIGGLTVFSLISLLRQGNPALLDGRIEWHIVPCIDPDGALLNEGWSQKAFTLEGYMRNFYVQPSQDQVDMSFPVSYKKHAFDQPSKEARVLKEIIDRVRPEFYCSLHNARVGSGAFLILSRDIDHAYHAQFHGLLEQYRVPLDIRPPHATWGVQFGEGIYEEIGVTAYYDYLEQKTTLTPEAILKGVGISAPEYLARIRNGFLAVVPELIYVRHPSYQSTHETGQSLRQLKLRIDAENKYLASVILDEWEKVKAQLDSSSPFYRKICQELVAVRDRLHEGMPLPWSFEQTRDLLFNPVYDKVATERDRFFAWLWGRFMPLCNAHVFVRLLNASTQTPAVRRGVERLEDIFRHALTELDREIDLDAFDVIDCDTLARVQLGSSLIALNSVLEEHGKNAAKSNAQT